MHNVYNSSVTSNRYSYLKLQTKQWINASALQILNVYKNMYFFSLVINGSCIGRYSDAGGWESRITYLWFEAVVMTPLNVYIFPFI